MRLRMAMIVGMALVACDDAFVEGATGDGDGAPPSADGGGTPTTDDGAAPISVQDASIGVDASRADGGGTTGDPGPGDGGAGNGNGVDAGPPPAGLLGGVGAIAAGYDHACALASGRVLCWGANEAGELGNGTTQGSSRPIAVAPFGNVTQVVAGGQHTCALTDAPAIWCWGLNDPGQLGTGGAVASLTPAAVVAASGGQPVEIAAGASHTCARMRDGHVVCWGSNDHGQLGDGTTNASKTGVRVLDLNDAVEIVAGVAHTCARRSGGGVVCWGDDGKGQLGAAVDPSLGVSYSTRGLAVGGLTDAVDLAAGLGVFACARRGAGGAVCWGDDAVGELGDGRATTQAVLTPVAVASLPSIAAIAVGYSHACARTAAGAAWCWGGNVFGELGDGTTHEAHAPVAVKGLSGVAQLAAGYRFSCALLASGAVQCWGENTKGELGDGTTTSRATAAPVLAP